jgi:hypothetical protein
MHVMFRMKNNRGHAEELDPDTCSRSFSIPNIHLDFVFRFVFQQHYIS